MNRKSSIKKFFVTITIKTPIAALLVTIITIVVLLVMGSLSYTNVYIKVKGSPTWIKSDNRQFIVQCVVDPKYLSEINMNKSVIWYIKKGKRYNGIIIGVSKLADCKNVNIKIKIKAAHNDIKNELSNNSVASNCHVNMEIFHRKEKIINKLLNNKLEDY
jgi:hypothetical protein